MTKMLSKNSSETKKFNIYSSTSTVNQILEVFI